MTSQQGDGLRSDDYDLEDQDSDKNKESVIANAKEIPPGENIPELTSQTVFLTSEKFESLPAVIFDQEDSIGDSIESEDDKNIPWRSASQEVLICDDNPETIHLDDHLGEIGKVEEPIHTNLMFPFIQNLVGEAQSASQLHQGQIVIGNDSPGQFSPENNCVVSESILDCNDSEGETDNESLEGSKRKMRIASRSDSGDSLLAMQGSDTSFFENYQMTSKEYYGGLGLRWKITNNDDMMTNPLILRHLNHMSNYEEKVGVGSPRDGNRETEYLNLPDSDEDGSPPETTTVIPHDSLLFYEPPDEVPSAVLKSEETEDSDETTSDDQEDSDDDLSSTSAFQLLQTFSNDTNENDEITNPTVDNDLSLQEYRDSEARDLNNSIETEKCEENNEEKLESDFSAENKEILESFPEQYKENPLISMDDLSNNLFSQINDDSSYNPLNEYAEFDNRLCTSSILDLTNSENTFSRGAEVLRRSSSSSLINIAEEKEDSEVFGQEKGCSASNVGKLEMEELVNELVTTAESFSQIHDDSSYNPLNESAEFDNVIYNSSILDLTSAENTFSRDAELFCQSSSPSIINIAEEKEDFGVSVQEKECSASNVGKVEMEERITELVSTAESFPPRKDDSSYNPLNEYTEFDNVIYNSSVLDLSTCENTLSRDAESFRRSSSSSLSNIVEEKEDSEVSVQENESSVPNAGIVEIEELITELVPPAETFSQINDDSSYNPLNDYAEFDNRLCSSSIFDLTISENNSSRDDELFRRNSSSCLIDIVEENEDSDVPVQEKECSASNVGTVDIEELITELVSSAESFSDENERPLCNLGSEDEISDVKEVKKAGTDENLVKSSVGTGENRSLPILLPIQTEEKDEDWKVRAPGDSAVAVSSVSKVADFFTKESIARAVNCMVKPNFEWEDVQGDELITVDVVPELVDSAYDCCHNKWKGPRYQVSPPSSVSTECKHCERKLGVDVSDTSDSEEATQFDSDDSVSDKFDENGNRIRKGLCLWIWKFWNTFRDIFRKRRTRKVDAINSTQLDNNNNRNKIETAVQELELD